MKDPSGPYVTTTFGMRGWYAVLIKDREPQLTGIGSYSTRQEAEEEAADWADAEGILHLRVETGNQS